MRMNYSKNIIFSYQNELNGLSYIFANQQANHEQEVHGPYHSPEGHFQSINTFGQIHDYFIINDSFFV